MNNKHKELNKLFSILKIKPKNINLYYQALTHKTFSNENRSKESYEKLEFIGDSLLQMYSSLYIYKIFNKESEGKMSIIRANNVSSESLAKIIKENKINNFLICSNNIEELKNNNKICSDIFESLIAAIYLDLGEKELLKFLDKFLFKQIKSSSIDEDQLKDPKTRLQELLQPIHKNPINYYSTHENGKWKCLALCSEITYGRGYGKTKKLAEIASAKDALNKLKIK